MKKSNVLFLYLTNHKKIYIITALMFIIGIILGVLIINITGNSKIESLTESVNEIVLKVKNIEFENIHKLFLYSIFQNCKKIGIIWILGCTIIGSGLIYIYLIYSGFKLGYTISSFIFTLGTKKGIILSLSTLLLQNIILIPILLLISVSGIKMSKETSKNRNNIRKEFLKHLIIFCICIILSIVASIAEVYASTPLLKIFKEIF